MSQPAFLCTHQNRSQRDGACREEEEEEEGGSAARWVIPEWPAGTTAVLALLPFQASRNCLVAVSSQDPVSPASRENMPFWVRVHRVRVQLPSISCGAKPSLAVAQLNHWRVSLVPVSRMVLSHFPRTGLRKRLPLCLCQTVFSLGPCFLHRTGTLMKSEKCGEGISLPIYTGKEKCRC